MIVREPDLPGRDQLLVLRTQLHHAQRELAPVCRDGLYATEALRELLYQHLPDLHAALTRLALAPTPKEP